MQERRGVKQKVEMHPKHHATKGNVDIQVEDPRRTTLLSEDCFAENPKRNIVLSEINIPHSHACRCQNLKNRKIGECPITSLINVRWQQAMTDKV